MSRSAPCGSGPSGRRRSSTTLTSELSADDDVGELLREHQSEIWAFLLSAVVIARLWFVQHNIVRHLVDYDARVAGVLMAWGLSIAFLPFPTALVADLGSDALTKVLYIGTMIVATALTTVVSLAMVRRPRLTDGHESESDPVVGVANVALLLVALAITVAVPDTSYAPLLLLLAADGLAGAWHRLRGSSA